MKNLRKIFEKYGLKLTDFQISLFDDYFRALVEGNKTVNLTAIVEEDEVLVKHFLDCALPEKFFPQNARVIDVGSGAGFPAIPLKIVRPDLNFVLLDSLNKRVFFLEKLKKQLNLQNVEPVHARAEDYARKAREQFDVATARAVAGLCTLVEYLLPFVKVGGAAIIYKSTKLDEELPLAQKAIETLGGKVENVVDFYVEEQDLHRKILIIRKVRPCPATYPRMGNKPRIQPLQ